MKPWILAAGAVLLVALVWTLGRDTGPLAPQMGPGSAATVSPWSLESPRGNEESITDRFVAAPVPSTELLAGARSGAEAPETEVVVVRVLGPSGEPIREAEVLFSSAIGAEEPLGTVNEEGCLRVEISREFGAWNIEARAPGWARTASQRMSAEPGRPGSPFAPWQAATPAPPRLLDSDEATPEGARELVLHLLVAAGSLEGRVVSSSGQAVADALVFLRAEDDLVELWPNGQTVRRDMLRAVSGPDGRYRFADVPPGVLTLGTRSVGFADHRSEVVIEAGITLAREIVLPKGVEVEGVVRDVHGRPVAGATVATGPRDRPVRQIQSKADGGYGLSGLRPGVTVWASSTAHGRDQVELQGQHSRWDPQLKPGWVVQGRIVVVDSPLGLGNWGVRFVSSRDGTRYDQRTRPDGTFRFADVGREVGHLEVRDASAQGLAWSLVEDVHPVEGEAPEESSLVVTVRPRDAGIHGRCAFPRYAGGELLLEHEAAGGQRAQRFERLTRGIEWGPDGLFEVRDLAPGRYHLRIEGRFRNSIVARFELRAGERLDLGTLHLPGTGFLCLELRGDEGRSRLRWQLERRGDGLIVFEGRGRWPERVPLDAGEYRLQVTLEPGARRHLDFRLAPHQVLRLPVSLDPRATVQLAVPPDVGEVELLEAGRSLARATARGRAVTFTLTSGSYRVRAIWASGEVQERTWILDHPSEGSRVSWGDLTAD